MPDAFDLQIVQRLSMSRLTGYLRASSNDISLALRLYEWNTQMSAAFFELLSDVEVVVRNSFHEQLTAWHGVQNGTDQWYDNGHGFLQPRATAAIQEARTRRREKVQTSKEEIPNMDERSAEARAAGNTQRQSQVIETIIRDRPKIGRNDRVTIKHIVNGQNKTLKYKQAEPLINKGEWVLVDN